MKTERATELLKHFKDHGVSLDPKNGLQYVLDYQDEIGHATPQEIVEFEEALKMGDEKKNFVWVNFHTLSQDSAIEIIKKTVVRRFIKKESDVLDDMYTEKFNEFNERSTQLHNAKKAIYKKIRGLETEKEKLASRLEWFETELRETRDINRKLREDKEEYRTKAQTYDDIKELLS